MVLIREATMSQSARVTIVMRTKDRPLLLRRALDDVRAQRYPHWHLVVVNDGGAPGPVDQLVTERAAAFAGRVTVLHNERSAGMEAASNQGVAAHPSDYVAIHDDDDTWDPRFLDLTVGHLDAHPAYVGVIARTEIILERIVGEGDSAVIVEAGRQVFWEDLTHIGLGDLLRINRAVPISLLYRRRMHDVVGPFREDLPAVGDWWFNLQLVQAGPVAFLADEPLAYWHQRRTADGDLGNSTYARHLDHRRFDSMVRDEALRDYVRDNGIGLPLYVAGLVNEQIGHLDRRLNWADRELNLIVRLLMAHSDELASIQRMLGTTTARGVAARTAVRVRDLTRKAGGLRAQRRAQPAGEVAEPATTSEPAPPRGRRRRSAGQVALERAVREQRADDERRGLQPRG